MYSIVIDLVLLLTLFDVSSCRRRINGGSDVTSPKSYVVYLVKSPKSIKEYDFWLCGGALVSSLFIISSAACVDDVEFIYAVAGYDKYVSDRNIEEDECTKSKKKKVVYTCIPMKYELQYDKIEKWSYIDIALLKVESAYDFNDQSYTSVCSYIPTKIAINYEPKYQEVNIDAMVFGWGHKSVWRKPDDHANYNQERLQYASTVVIDKAQCKKQYELYPMMGDVIDQFMICTSGSGYMDDKGNLIMKSPPTAQGCMNKNTSRLYGIENRNCDEEEFGNNNNFNYNNNNENSYYPAEADNTRYSELNDDTRRKVNKTMSTYNTLRNEFLNKTKYTRRKNNKFSYSKNNDTRRNGICQNDHGGPLVTWVGAHEVLIGVASVFRVSSESTCMGPYLYTSTQCNGAFIDCVLSSDGSSNSINRRICDSPPIQRGYDTVEKHISWKNHPDGPADNERYNAKIKHIDYETLSETTKTPNVVGRFQDSQMIVAVRPQRPLRV